MSPPLTLWSEGVGERSSDSERSVCAVRSLYAGRIAGLVNYDLRLRGSGEVLLYAISLSQLRVVVESHNKRNCRNDAYEELNNNNTHRCTGIEHAVRCTVHAPSTDPWVRQLVPCWLLPPGRQPQARPICARSSLARRPPQPPTTTPSVTDCSCCACALPSSCGARPCTSTGNDQTA
jgi:hypothetical protein